jgi:hypothetical protein
MLYIMYMLYINNTHILHISDTHILIYTYFTFNTTYTTYNIHSKKIIHKFYCQFGKRMEFYVIKKGLIIFDIICCILIMWDKKYKVL